MKTLVLMRHASTEPTNENGDKARTLLPEGREQAAAAGQELAGLGLERAIVSTAERTRQTFDALDLDIPAEYQEAVYEGTTETLLQRITETDDDVEGLLVIGHAPTIGLLASDLAHPSNPEEAEQLQSWFPAGTFVTIHLDCSFSELASGRENPTELVSIRRP